MLEKFFFWMILPWVQQQCMTITNNIRSYRLVSVAWAWLLASVLIAPLKAVNIWATPRAPSIVPRKTSKHMAPILYLHLSLRQMETFLEPEMNRKQHKIILSIPNAARIFFSLSPLFWSSLAPQERCWKWAQLWLAPSQPSIPLHRSVWLSPRWCAVWLLLMCSFYIGRSFWTELALALSLMPKQSCVKFQNNSKILTILLFLDCFNTNFKSKGLSV